MAVEVLQRQPGELGLDLAAQAVHGPLRDAGHEVLLQPPQDRREKVDGRGKEQDLRELCEIDAGSGHDIRPRQHVGELTLAARPQRLDGLFLRDARGQRLADDPVEDHVRRVADELRADHAENDARRREHRDDRDRHPFRTQARDKPPECAAEVLRLLDGHAHAHEAAATWPRARPVSRPPHHHHAAASPSWDSTISRYSTQPAMSSSCVPMPTTRPSSRTTI